MSGRIQENRQTHLREANAKRCTAVMYANAKNQAAYVCYTPMRTYRNMGRMSIRKSRLHIENTYIYTYAYVYKDFSNA